jgi:DNA-binding NarL/FixJ family response regulator
MSTLSQALEYASSLPRRDPAEPSRSSRISTSNQQGRSSERQRVIDHARTTVGQSTALIAASREALETLKASRAAQARLRHHENGAAPTATGHENGATATGVEVLTARQLEILGYLADGLNTKQIAERLWLSRATVRNHVSGIFLGLECHSRLEAVAKARQLGLI